MAQIIENMPEAEYHARPEVSKHDLDLIRRAPLLYRYRKDNPEEPDDEMNFGSLVHLAILQPHLLESSVAFLPEGAPRRPSQKQRDAKKQSSETLESIAFWDDWKEKTAGKQIVTHETFERVKGIQESIMRNPATAQFLEQDTQREVSLFWEMNGVNCRARLDMLADGAVIDIKTTGDASPSGFARDIARYGYHQQGAYYLDASESVGRKAKKFVFLTVETVAPFLCTFHILGPTSIEVGRVQNRRALETYKRCAANNEWPNMPAPYDGEEIECPLYAL